MPFAPPRQPKSVSLITYGCAKNLVDSEAMLGCLSRAGYSPLPDPEKADVIILNTCGFIKPAKEEAVQAIEEAVELKKRMKEKIVVVTGCYVERYKDSLRKRYPEVNIWLGVKDFDKIVPALEGKSFGPGKETFLLSHTTPRLVSTPRSWAYLKISEGCSHECSFCAIPLIKGPYRSRNIYSLVEETKNLAARGVREINLVSQDTTHYGRDQGKKDGLFDLLRKLVDIPKLRWIRLLYGYPEEISASLIEIMQEEKVCSYLDLPFQHSDRRLLKAMKRSMDGKRGLALIENIRKRIPDVALRTSLIVGFPGEGRREFESLKAFVRAVRFDHLGVFTYSPEAGTNAFRYADSIPEEVKEKRREEVMAIQAEISLANNRKYLGKKVEAIIESPAPGKRNTVVGRGRFQAPEVDGIILIKISSSVTRRINPLERVEIIASDIYDLQGKIVQ